MVEASIPKWQLQVFCDRIREAFVGHGVQDGWAGLDHVTMLFVFFLNMLKCIFEHLDILIHFEYF